VRYLYEELWQEDIFVNKLVNIITLLSCLNQNVVKNCEGWDRKLSVKFIARSCPFLKTGTAR